MIYFSDNLELVVQGLSELGIIGIDFKDLMELILMFILINCFGV